MHRAFPRASALALGGFLCLLWAACGDDDDTPPHSGDTGLSDGVADGGAPDAQPEWRAFDAAPPDVRPDTPPLPDTPAPADAPVADGAAETGPAPEAVEPPADVTSDQPADAPRDDTAEPPAWPDPVPYGGWAPLSHAGVSFGASVEGRPILVERFGDVGPVLFAFHTIHGNELPAQQLGERLRTWLLLHPEATDGVQVLFLALANPDGFVHDSRYNVNGIDLNRNFPASNFEPSPVYGPEPASEPETRLLVALVEDAEPFAIVTVHSPLDAINYDGPAADLADAMADASGLPVDQDIGFYPGSFGSWAGIDLQIPTVTLELPADLPTLAEHAPGLAAERAALAYVRAEGPPGNPLNEIVAPPDVPRDYETWTLGQSPAERPLVVERIGDLGQPVLVVAGLDGEPMPVAVAERLRARLVARLSAEMRPAPVLLVTVANPDGVLVRRPLDNAGLDPDRNFPQGFVASADAGATPLSCVETVALAELVAAEAPAAIVVLLGSKDTLAVGADGPAERLLEALLSTLYGTPSRTLDARPGSLAAWAGGQGIAAVTVRTPDTPQHNDVARADRVALAVLAAIDAAGN